jgi:2-keto-4-pentenoate hydratase
MTSAPDVNDLATKLMGEYDQRVPFANHALKWTVPDLAGAYDLQSAFVDKLAERHGAPAGYKVALTSKRMQQMCGIDQPLAGVVLANRIHKSGITVSLSSYDHLGIEFEITVKLARPLPARSNPYRFDEVAAAVGAIAPSFELVDDRRADYKTLDVLSLTSDNAWNAGAVLGEFHDQWPDLESILGMADRNDERFDSGHGRDALGHPFNSLLWLANHLSKRGQGLRAGDIVMTGSLVSTRFPEAGESYRFTLEGVGSAEVSFTA